MNGRYPETWYVDDEEKLNLLVAADQFKTAMVKKLWIKQNLGYSGWNRKTMRSIIGKKLREHIKKGFKDQDNIIDIANLLMFLWHQREVDKAKKKEVI